MDFAEVARMKADMKKVYLIVQQIKRNLEIETEFELERKGLRRICIENNIEYNELDGTEREEIWKELIKIVEEIKYKKYYADLYMGDD